METRATGKEAAARRAVMKKTIIVRTHRNTANVSPFNDLKKLSKHKLVPSCESESSSGVDAQTFFFTCQKAVQVKFYRNLQSS